MASIWDFAASVLSPGYLGVAVFALAYLGLIFRAKNVSRYVLVRFNKLNYSTASPYTHCWWAIPTDTILPRRLQLLLPPQRNHTARVSEGSSLPHHS